MKKVFLYTFGILLICCISSAMCDAFHIFMIAFILAALLFCVYLFWDAPEDNENWTNRVWKDKL